MINQVQKLDRLSGEVIATFKSAAEASRVTGANHSKICRACRGNIRMTGGYAWKRAGDKDYTFISCESYQHNTYSTIQQLDIKTGEVIATFKSAAEASRVKGANQSKISRVCKGKRPRTGGYKWRYTPTN